jgi:hypothetical protein
MLEAQDDLQAAPAQAYGVQSTDSGVPQDPVPVQVADPSALFPLQVAAAHTTLVPGIAAHAPAPSQVPGAPQMMSVPAGHSLSGSDPATIAPQTPSAPFPFFRDVQAWHVPLQALSQQTPSVQNPEAQSVPVMQTLPFVQRVAQAAALPPQSTAVSVPSLVALLQDRVPPQPFDGAPQVAPTSAQVFGVQPQAWAVPPPPQV